ncbi:hypothetical protein [Nesterenkonia massiliensis]|nr:hypothetical protein [Nesterenkonia massiliensis]
MTTVTNPAAVLRAVGEIVVGPAAAAAWRWPGAGGHRCGRHLRF